MAQFAGVSSTTMRNRAADIRAALPENARFVADISYRDDVFGNYCYDEIYDDDIYEDEIYNEDIHNLDKIKDILSKSGTAKEDLGRILDAIRGLANQRFEDEEEEELEKYEIYFNKAQDTDDIDESIENMKLAVKYAKKKVPKRVFKELDGELWIDFDARPYLSMKAQLAYLYVVKEDYQAAMDIYSEILKLNVSDNQGIRHKIFPILILLDKEEMVEDLLETYDMDESAFMLYDQALYNYKNKNEFNAKSFLKKAFKANKYVPEYLLGMKMFDLPVPNMYSHGSDEEAIIYLDDSLFAWVQTDKSLYWLADEYFAYAKKKGMKLMYTKAEVKDFIDDAIERVNNLEI